MLMRYVSLGVLGGLFIGVVLTETYYKEYVLPASAEGVVKYYVTPPGGTGFPPTGYFVDSRIYLERSDKKLLGQRVSVSGRLDSIPGPDGSQVYPLLHVDTLAQEQRSEAAQRSAPANSEQPPAATGRRR